MESLSLSSLCMDTLINTLITNSILNTSMLLVFFSEPIICEGSPDIKILSDDWTAVTEDSSRSAQFEHTILVTQDGYEILTK